VTPTADRHLAGDVEQTMTAVDRNIAASRAPTTTDNVELLLMTAHNA